MQQATVLSFRSGIPLLYLDSIYLRANQVSSLPELKKVILADQANVAYADTLQQAIDQLVGTSTAPPPTTTPPTVITPAVLAQITDLVTQANVHYTAAYNDLKNGDFAGFASEMKQVGDILQQMQKLTCGSTSARTRATPAPGRPTTAPSQSPYRRAWH